MDSTRREISNGALFVHNHVIEQVGTTVELPQTADETLDL
jgi:8-oxoguanine deaminase